jgi:type II secretory pathway predicted ATPase ExeA
VTHPLFKKDMFIETAFARRFQKMLQDAWDNRSWHLLVADPGAGKTMSIRDLQKRAGGRSVLAVVAPKNNDDEQALGDQFLAALGLPIRGHWSTRKPKLMGHLHQYGTEFLIVDDAHDLSAAASDVAQRSDGPGAVAVRSSAGVVSGGRRARRHDSLEGNIRFARSNVAAISSPFR